jgi:hypothetical protein
MSSIPAERSLKLPSLRSAINDGETNGIFSPKNLGQGVSQQQKQFPSVVEKGGPMQTAVLDPDSRKGITPEITNNGSQEAQYQEPHPEILDVVTIQGGALRTWSFPDPTVERVEVLLKTDGRPLNVNIDLWQGPDNTPERVGVYIEDGQVRPFCAIFETPRGPSTLAIRNAGQLEYPVAAHVEAGDTGLLAVTNMLDQRGTPIVIQGGATRSFSFAHQVESVQVLLKTNGRPLNARVEVMQGPNNNRQVIELYTEDGLERSFFTIIETPVSKTTLRVINTAPSEFPLTARVEPYMVLPGYPAGELVTSDDPILTWGNLLNR